MPCYTDGPSGPSESEFQVLRNKVERLTDMLCHTLNANPNAVLRDDVTAWYQDHKIKDLERKKSEVMYKAQRIQSLEDEIKKLREGV